MTVRIVSGDPEWMIHCDDCNLDLEYDAEDRYNMPGGTAIMCAGCAKFLWEPQGPREQKPNLGLSIHRYSDEHVCLEFASGWLDVKLSAEGLSLSVYNSHGTMVTEAWAHNSDFVEELPDPPEFFVLAED